MWRHKRRVGAVLILAVLLWSATAPLPRTFGINLWRRLAPPDPVRERQEMSSFASRSSIQLGIAGPMADIRDTNLFLEGVEMAVQQCNDSGLLPIPLETVTADDRNAISNVLTVAGQFAQDPQVVAVIGHWGSEFSLAAAQIYEQAGLPMLTPVSTNPILTQSDLHLVLRSVPSDDAIGAWMARYARQQGFDKVAVLYADDMTGLYVAHAFESAAGREGVDVIDKRVMHTDIDRFDEAYRRWCQAGLDALVIADIITRNTELIRHIISLDPSLPLLATDAYDYSIPLQSLSQQAHNLHVVTFFNPTADGQTYRAFRSAFFQRYGQTPDYWALQGYDSVMLLHQAFYRAGTLDAQQVVQALKEESRPFLSATGNTIVFQSSGDIANPVIYVKQYINGEVRFEGGSGDGN